MEERIPGYVMPEFESIEGEKWSAGNVSIRQVLKCVLATYDSYEKRIDVINHMQRLIRTTVGAEVFPYGSVPLRTFLPEGDIDLTIISVPRREDTLANDVFQVLQHEEQKENAEYKIHDLQFIGAEVKIIKCIIGGIVMDVSFNQLGGLSSLCFLEEADKHIGKDHLFKRSIVLIKSWCYYESRVIGAHYGLFSTYALEILVLFIVLKYEESLTDPLMVLYRFLEHYSKLDWDKFCMTIDGPMSFSSLLVTIDENHASGNVERLRKPINLFVVPLSECDTDIETFNTNMQTFNKKYLNIIDPLKVNNNLGRSVNRATSHRIKSAFKLGARTLGGIMELPTENIGDEIKKFFKCTLKRHQKEIIIPAILTFDELTTAPVTIDHYSDDSDTDLSNADFENLRELSERDLPTVFEQEEVLVSDNGNQEDEYDVFNDEDLLDLETLYGDFKVNMRSLLISHRCHVFATPGPLFKLANPVKGIERKKVAGYQTSQHNPSATQWYPYGGPMHLPPSLTYHGVERFVAFYEKRERLKESMRGRGRGRGRGPTRNQQQPRRDFQRRKSPLGFNHSVAQPPVARMGFEAGDPTLGPNNNEVPNSPVQPPVAGMAFEAPLGPNNHEVPESRVQSTVFGMAFEDNYPPLVANLKVPDSRVQSSLAGSSFEDNYPPLVPNNHEVPNSPVQPPMAFEAPLGGNHVVPDSGVQSKVVGSSFEDNYPPLVANHEVPDSGVQSTVFGSSFEDNYPPLVANNKVVVESDHIWPTVFGSSFEDNYPPLVANYKVVVESNHIWPTVTGKDLKGKAVDLGTNDNQMQSPVTPFWGFRGMFPNSSSIGYDHPGASSSQVNEKLTIQFGPYSEIQQTDHNAVVSGPTWVKDEPPLKLADQLEFPPL